MALQWTDFSNGETLQSIRNKLNTFNNKVVVENNDVTTSISNNATNIQLNTVDLAEQDGKIGNNTTNIAALDVEVVVLEDRLTVVEEEVAKTFKYVKAAPALDIAEGTPQLIATLTVPSLIDGVYFQSYSFEVDFKGVKDKTVHFRADIDGATGTVFDVQSDKKSNHKNRLYGYPKVRTAGPYEMKFYMWKETGFVDPVDVNYCDLVIEGK